MKSKKGFLAALIILTAALAFGSPVRADLAAVGPLDPATDFATFFTDLNGLSVGPCDVITNPFGGINGPPCSALALHDFNLGFVADNIEEVTYYRAEAVSGNNSRLRIEVQGGGCLAPGPCTAEIISNVATIRLNPGDMTPGLPGNYIVDTPIGQFTIPIADPAAVFADTLPLNTVSSDGFPASVPPYIGALGPNPGGAAFPVQVGGAPAVSFFVPNGTGPVGFLGDSLTVAPLSAGFGWPLPGGTMAFRLRDPNGVEKFNIGGFTVEGKVAAFLLTLAKAGNGAGTVTSAPAGINCDPANTDCSQTYAPGTLVNLSPSATAPNIFISWSGCDSVNPVTNVCSVIMNFARTVTATFGAPDIQVSPAVHSFGTINIGSLDRQTFTVSNNGMADLSIGTITMTGSLTFSKVNDGCSGQVLPPSGVCTVQGQFQPGGVPGAAATMTIPSNDPGTPSVGVVMSGFGTDTQVFSDVAPTNIFENHINSLFYTGISGGCSAGLFCPGDPVDRGQMAAFIIRALEGDPATATLTVPLSGAEELPPVGTGATGTGTLTINPITGAISGNVTFSGLSSSCSAIHLHEGTPLENGPVIVFLTGSPGLTSGTWNIPPGSSLTASQLLSLAGGNVYFQVHTVAFPLGEIRGRITTTFADVSTGHVFFTSIERMFDIGVTGGCGFGNYCPSDVVTREQMAAFIIRALEGEPAGACTVQTFNDVPTTNPFCKHIERMAALGITGGCGGGNYCPTDVVTREQMAAFLGRAFLGMP